MRAVLVLVIAVASVLAPVGVAAVDLPSAFEQWLADQVGEARERGYTDGLLGRTLRGLRPLLAVLESDGTQAETKLTFDEYVRRRVTPDARPARTRARADTR